VTRQGIISAVPLSLILDSLVRSIQVGSLYALMALGLTLTLAVLRLPNFAHAELITLGAYAALLASFWSTNLPIILGASFFVAALAAWLTHRAVFRPLAQLKLSMYALILASFAVGLIWRYLIFLFVDTSGLFDKRIQVPLQIWLRTPNVILTNIFFSSVPTALVLMLALSTVLNRTDLGRQMRALADNETLARVMGLRVARVHDLTWLIVGGLAGVGGAFWGMYTSLNPLMGWITILSVFAASILGGMTSFSGTILGAYIVAFSENLLMQWLNFQFGLDFTFKAAVPFVIIIVVLLLRPQGLTDFFKRA
jgi:branched-subunit amino acid ABC-type transport system permease component